MWAGRRQYNLLSEDECIEAGRIWYEQSLPGVSLTDSAPQCSLADLIQIESLGEQHQSVHELILEQERTVAAALFHLKDCTAIAIQNLVRSQVV